MAREASFYERIGDGAVRCALCSHRCRIPLAGRGVCGVRENRDGRLDTLVYGRLVAENVDPIEKKPLFHVHPGSLSYSIATAGCNFRCRFCQNHEISQWPRETGQIPGRDTQPEAIVRRAVQAGCRTIAYTYTEPTVFFEYAADIGRLARTQGLRNVFVTNGYLTSEALEAAAPWLDAANVDLKSFRDAFYRQECGARLPPVLETLGQMKRLGLWVEVTTLLIPGLNDSDEELRDLASFLCSLGAETPWHVSRFHPQYRLQDRPPTSAQAIRRAVEIGRAAGLRHVYSGNLPGDPGEDTFCGRCGRRLLARHGFAVTENRLQGGRCPACGAPLAGLFSAPNPDPVP